MDYRTTARDEEREDTAPRIKKLRLPLHLHDNDEDDDAVETDERDPWDDLIAALVALRERVVRLGDEIQELAPGTQPRPFHENIRSAFEGICSTIATCCPDPHPRWDKLDPHVSPKLIPASSNANRHQEAADWMAAHGHEIDWEAEPRVEIRRAKKAPKVEDEDADEQIDVLESDEGVAHVVTDLPKSRDIEYARPEGWGNDVPWDFSGLGLGEKLPDELVRDAESMAATAEDGGGWVFVSPWGAPTKIQLRLKEFVVLKYRLAGRTTAETIGLALRRWGLAISVRGCQTAFARLKAKYPNATIADFDYRLLDCEPNDLWRPEDHEELANVGWIFEVVEGGRCTEWPWFRGVTQWAYQRPPRWKCPVCGAIGLASEAMSHAIEHDADAVSRWKGQK